MESKRLLTDSGGPGKRRGGVGVEYTLRCVADAPITLTIRPDLVRNPAPGLFEGLPGGPGNVFMNGKRVERFIPLTFSPGDVCVLQVPGGGGFGDPRKRERDLVRRDVANGLVSVKAAREIYGLDLQA